MDEKYASLQGKRLLISGGTGTFGNAVLRHSLMLGLSEIIVFSRDEKKQDEMRRFYASPRIKWVIGDVRDYGALADAMAEVDFVFHAAALKQVPSCEFYPMEAVRTNVLGTENVCNAATASGVKRMILLSTDKAAYPINAMGMSKALAEKIVAAKSRVAGDRGTVLCCTRYGNVMASRGSVIPLFIEQLRAGRPLTLTDPRMTRFMMSIDDAVNLVLYAFENAEPGDLFVRKAQAATMETLAESIQRVFDRSVGTSVIGTRHGEKLYETLLTREEMAHATDMGDYFRVPADSRDLNYTRFYTQGERELSQTEDYHSHNASRLDVDSLTKLLGTLEEVREALRARAA
ncbi:MAG: polysaccharide biosynthesis protein [Gemmatimonadota bacterium]|nr:polysaccharide biosynthesis protein [Gemmatimonadota bacterium]